jgi:hypothetical protein
LVQAKFLRVLEQREFQRLGGTRSACSASPAPSSTPASRSTTSDSSIGRRSPNRRSPYSANNHGVYQSLDRGQSWEQLAIAWPDRFRTQRAAALVALETP